MSFDCKTPEDVARVVKENDVRHIDLRFTDPRGKWQHLTQLPETIDEPEVQPDAFAEAALTNGASVQAPESKAKPTRGPSLLERMTGTGRARQKAREAESTSHEPSFGRRDQAEPGAPAPQPEIKAEPVVTPEPVAPKTSSSMPAIDPADRLAPAADDDLLDIPAFLRRQAN